MTKCDRAQFSGGPVRDGANRRLADDPPLRADQTAYLALYKELVETNTTLSAGSCTVAAEHIAAHLKSAGFEDKDITLFSVPDHPKEGGIVAVLQGSSKSAKPMLLLGHLDVVEAKREDWARDPFEFIEENGYYYGRGTSDMKAMDATWVDALMRFKQSGYHPKRTIKMALTCGEETTYAFNGAEWLAKNKPELIAAAFALNEGGGRAHGRAWQGRGGVDPGGREGVAELPSRDHQSRWPQLHSDSRQCDL